jgi:glutaredoxin
MLIGSPKCIHCTNLKQKLEENSIPFEYKFHEEIKDAIDYAKERTKTNLSSIPVLISLATGHKVPHDDVNYLKNL